MPPALLAGEHHPPSRAPSPMDEQYGNRMSRRGTSGEAGNNYFCATYIIQNNATNAELTGLEIIVPAPICPRWCPFRSTLMGNCSECASLSFITYIVSVCNPPKVGRQSNHGQLRCPKNKCSDPDRPKVGRIPDSHWDELSGMHLAFDHRGQHRPLRQVRSAPPSGTVKRDPSRNKCSRGTLTKVSDVSDSPGQGLSSAGLIFGERRRDHLFLGLQILYWK